jgi:DNA polymerase delta subunit 1
LSSNEYQSKQPHVELAGRMNKRDPSSAPALGDRIPYIIIAGVRGKLIFFFPSQPRKTKNSLTQMFIDIFTYFITGDPIYEKAESPSYVKEKGLAIDAEYYMKQLSSPLISLFRPILGDGTESILCTYYVHLLLKCIKIPCLILILCMFS